MWLKYLNRHTEKRTALKCLGNSFRFCKKKRYTLKKRANALEYSRTYTKVLFFIKLFIKFYYYFLKCSYWLRTRTQLFSHFNAREKPKHFLVYLCKCMYVLEYPDLNISTITTLTLVWWTDQQYQDKNTIKPTYFTATAYPGSRTHIQAYTKHCCCIRININTNIIC